MCTAPLDVVKIRLQLQVSGNKYQGILHTVKVIAKEEGMLALWKGNVPAAVMYILYGAAQFSSYSMYNNILSDLQTQYNYHIGPASHSFILGSLAGCTSTIISYPFDLLRTRFANEPKFSKLSTTVSNIFKEEGALGFFKGVNAGMVSISLYTGLMFWSYEISRMVSQSSQKYQPILEPLCGLSAGVFAKSVVFPLDLIRKRLQVNKAKNQNFIKAGLKVVKVEGVKGLYKGFLASIIKSAPTTAISIWTYEHFLRVYKSD
ncbi:Mitochondrial aspartate-glutamate transporter AGC1 [Wickerhamomyces ciferrii]|uniref:Mitochondrial aspartate-glutamate transporter AGC1 n=1 Tax=Wickerhamomyces ciferrii (strain ATCC 14091 / BCRC 22168 / CBS 111 / JCM 3599 / NBRC 0793 / NRRL Y-1031 F-60-10) TaxID=1206466 RepID=K0KBJ6_WICCF|nr:Mitochondrial aspartate-glutamate transporter AGC1 [Wickerhamomyces ciferrii]CCH42405.1 Mitochondrial aspartate-glutamate transporter AGC1 [Wickerhamomyces ciferrii]